MKYEEKTVTIDFRSKKFKIQTFDSIGDFTEYLKTAETNRFFKGQELSSKSTGDLEAKFRGTKSYEEAETLLATGWVAAAERLSKKLPVQTTQHTINRTKPTYGMVGGQASVPRYLQGVPTNMVDRKQVPQKQKIIVLNREVGFSAMVSTEQIEAEGIKALQLIQTLENRGYRVKLNLTWVSSEHTESLVNVICVKKPEERLSIAKIAFPLVHPSMLRRILFRSLEVNPHMTTGEFVAGYGSPSGKDMKYVLPKTEYFLPNFIPSVDKFIDGMGL